MKAIAIIPARMNSKRFPGKNMAMLGGKPMVQYSITAAVESGVFDDIYIDYMGMEWGASQHVMHDFMLQDNVHFKWRADILRPYKTTGDDIITWYMDNYEADCYCCLQPTTPFRTATHIQDCYELFKEYDKNVISVNKYTLKPNGGIYMTKPGVLPYEGEVMIYKMSPESSVDIDYKYQLKIAEGVLNGKQIPEMESTYYQP